MKESHTYCVCCGRKISTVLAKRFAGYCLNCDEEKGSTVESEYLPLPQELENRLGTPDDPSESPIGYHQIGNLLGIESGSWMVDPLELERALYYRWSPCLLEFGQTCRESDPGPSIDQLSPKEKVIQQVYRKKLVPHFPKPFALKINVCLMPRMAIPVARTVWSKLPQNTVILTPDEYTRWIDNYQPSETEAPDSETKFRWLHYHRWEVKDAPTQIELQFSRVEVQEGRDPWIVEHEVSEAAASRTVELWTWDGTSVEFERVLHDMLIN